ncbi:hypothetical protein LP420_06480 [Massilia sp. B-10]|nr:hypothetical protein LP420_06480 [Massilia sp. B-10]
MGPCACTSSTSPCSMPLEGGGVSTYLNAKARWLARHSHVRHTIFSSNVATAGLALALVVPANRVRAGPAWLPFSAVGGVLTRMMARAARSDRSGGRRGRGLGGAAGQAPTRHSGSGLLSFRPAAPDPRALRPAGHAGARRYLAQLYRQFDMVLAPSRLMAQHLGAMGIA